MSDTSVALKKQESTVYRLNAAKLGTMVRSKRSSRGLRETAREIGDLSPSTLSRVENSHAPDLDTFLLLCNWLSVPPSEFFLEDTPLETPDRLEILLRADAKLEPATANALAALVKAAYQNLRPEAGAEDLPEKSDPQED